MSDNFALAELQNEPVFSIPRAPKEPGLRVSADASVSLNSAKYQSDLTTGGATYALKDKQEVNYPEVMYKARLTYAYQNLSAHIDGQYMGRRYISYNNDNYAPGYWVSNAGISDRINLDGSVKSLTVGLNVYNLFNATYTSITGETRYSPTYGGSVLFVRNDNLYAQKLNISRTRLEGNPILVETSVASSAGTIHSDSFSVSRNGVLAWRPGREYAEQLLDSVEKEAENFLGGALTGSGVEWLT